MASLQNLNLSSCLNITLIPRELYGSPSLVSLDVRDTPKLEQIPDAIKSDPAAVLEFLATATERVPRVSVFGVLFSRVLGR